MIFTKQAQRGEEVTIKKAHIKKENKVIIKIIHTKEEALILQEATEVEVMLIQILIESLIIKIKITKLKKKMEMKCRKKEKLTIEAEDLIKRMEITFREDQGEVLTEVLIEIEEEMKKISKIIMKLKVATIIIEEIGEEVEVVIKSKKMSKLSINLIMRIINLNKIAKNRKILKLLLVISWNLWILKLL
jgi:hypothetical protein